MEEGREGKRENLCTKLQLHQYFPSDPEKNRSVS